jgi:hypothetical protein
MMQREGRMASPAAGASGGKLNPPKTVRVRSWEGPIFAGALVVILILGSIAGLRSLLALFPQ